MILHNQSHLSRSLSQARQIHNNNCRTVKRQDSRISGIDRYRSWSKSSVFGTVRSRDLRRLQLAGLVIRHSSAGKVETDHLCVRDYIDYDDQFFIANSHAEQ